MLTVILFKLLTNILVGIGILKIWDLKRWWGLAIGAAWIILMALSDEYRHSMPIRNPWW